MAKMRTERLAKRLMLWGAIGLGTVLILFLANATWGLYGKMAEAKRLEDAAAENKAGLVTRKADLEATLDQLATARGVEAEIRSRYPLVKPGEQEFVLVDAETSIASTSPKAETGLWGWLMGLLGL